MFVFACFSFGFFASALRGFFFVFLPLFDLRFQVELTKDNYKTYVPQPLIKKERRMGASEWRKESDGPKKKLKGTEKSGAIHRYVKFARQWGPFSATFFKAKQITKPYNIILAIQWHGVYVLKAGERKPVASYRYSDILSWSPAVNTFSIRVCCCAFVVLFVCC